MSLIERALQKSRDADPHPPSVRGPRAPTAPATPAPASAPQLKLRHATVDAEQAERSAALLHPTDHAAERAYKILRTQLLRKLGDAGSGVIAVTAVNIGDGKTITSLNLALSLARDVTTRVTLVDLDLQRPSIARYIGMRADAGLDDYLSGRAASTDVYYEIGIERLVVIPSLNPLMHSSEAIRSPAMKDFLGELRSQRRVVILDLPPLLMGDDVLAIAPQTDGVLLVVGEGNTPRAALAGARTYLSEMNVIGVVLNRSAENADASYY